MSYCLNPDCPKPNQNQRGDQKCQTCGTPLLLQNRYRAQQPIGQGGFGVTYLAQDEQRPGQPQCVIKRLKPYSQDTQSLDTARRLFDQEAMILEKLGQHDQIPRLLAHFEQDGEFYLIQEYIEGEDLEREIKVLSEPQAIALIQEILEILQFVHESEVIHRDLKPSNLIRRKPDNKLVMIDFGAVKQINSPSVVPSKKSVSVTVGTPGYMPSEQAGGRPRYSSDIYATGMLGIYALTGIHPGEISRDENTGELIWRELVRCPLSLQFEAVLTKMVRDHFSLRYQTVTEVLKNLKDVNEIPRTVVRESDDPRPTGLPDPPTVVVPRATIFSNLPVKFISPSQIIPQSPNKNQWLGIGTFMAIILAAMGSWIYLQSMEARAVPLLQAIKGLDSLSEFAEQIVELELKPSPIAKTEQFSLDPYLASLDPDCRRAIDFNRPTLGTVGEPTLGRDESGDMEIRWSGPFDFYPDGINGEMSAAFAIGIYCPSIVRVTFLGGTGASSRWYIRRNRFAIRHSRDSGYPGDYDVYWHSNSIPFNYDPEIDYFPDVRNRALDRQTFDQSAPQSNERFPATDSYSQPTRNRALDRQTLDQSAPQSNERFPTTDLAPNARVPEQFWGKWDERYGTCDMKLVDFRLTITATEFRWWESTGRVVAVHVNGLRDILVEHDVYYSESETTERESSRFVLSEDMQTITHIYKHGRVSRVRCK
ncbi:MAG: serine/threonine protein kinase [Cyanobacteria bacterium LVE1205-1]|jgi:serine/threonine protein kinase